MEYQIGEKNLTFFWATGEAQIMNTSFTGGHRYTYTLAIEKWLILKQPHLPNVTF